MTTITYALVRFILLLPAIVLHEVSHGYVALRLGDTTARDRGRLSLNPIRHIDPWGTLLLPALLLAISGGTIAFGYAKPVPINPYRFKDYRNGMFLTGIAGPTTNLLLAAASGTVVRLMGPEQVAAAFAANLSFTAMTPTAMVAWLFWSFASVNLVLLFFNLIPIPPLDGSRVIPLFLSDRGMQKYHQIEQYGFIILLGVLWGVPYIFHVDPVSLYFDYTVVPLMKVFTGIA